MQETRTEKAVVKKEIAAFALAVVLTAVFIGSLISGTAKWDESFSRSTLVKVENFSGGRTSIISSVEEASGARAVVASSSGLLLLEIPTEYSAPLAEKIESALEGAGGEVGVLEVDPLFNHQLFNLFLTAVAVSLVALGFVLLLIFRRKRISWVCPLTIGLTVGEALGLFVLTGFPVGLGAIVGTTIVFLYLLNLCSVVLTNQIRSDEEVSRLRKNLKELAFSALGVLLLIFGTFTLLSRGTILIDSLVVILLGGILGYLNFERMMIPLLREKIHPAVAKYHVSL